MHWEKNGHEINLDTAMAHVDGDRELLAELSAMFLEDYPALIEEMKTSILNRDTSTLERIAHTLKGRFAFFGVQSGSSQVVELERMGHDKNLAGALKTLDDMETALEKVLPEIQKLLQEQA
jgi:two-component system, sensor histidine kinase and response regulator